MGRDYLQYDHHIAVFIGGSKLSRRASTGILLARCHFVIKIATDNVYADGLHSRQKLVDADVKSASG